MEIRIKTDYTEKKDSWLRNAHKIVQNGTMVTCFLYTPSGLVYNGPRPGTTYTDLMLAVPLMHLVLTSGTFERSSWLSPVRFDDFPLALA